MFNNEEKIKMFNAALYKRFEELAKSNKMTISQWCLKSGLTPSTLYDIKHKKSKIPNVLTIKKLCESIDITLSKFFDVDYIEIEINE